MESARDDGLWNVLTQKVPIGFKVATIIGVREICGIDNLLRDQHVFAGQTVSVFCI